MFVFLFENFVGRARRFRRPRFGAKKEEKDEQRKKYSMKTNVFTDFPLSDSLVILNHTRSSAAEAKTSMTLRIFFPIFQKFSSSSSFLFLL